MSLSEAEKKRLYRDRKSRGGVTVFDTDRWYITKI